MQALDRPRVKSGGDRDLMPEYLAGDKERPDDSHSLDRPLVATTTLDEKLFFVVPFARKGEAKALGLQWDSKVGKWYSTDPAISAKAMLIF